MNAPIDWNRAGALTFDCFGTLVDWERGILRDLKAALTTRTGKDASLHYDDDELLRFYGQAEPASQAGPFKPYRDVLKTTLLRIADAAHLRIADPDALVKGLATWPLFDDARAALARLKTRFRIGLVTNCDRDLVEPIAAGFGVAWDAIVTSEDVQAYKPNPRLLHEAQARLGVDAATHVHVAQSLYHDIEPATALGIATVHVDRRGGRPGGATPRATTTVAPALRVPDLAALAATAAP